MSTDNFDDDLIYAAFDDFTQAAAPSVKITGTAAIRTTVRRRRTVQATSLGLLSALLIAVPVMAYAVRSHPNNSPPLISAGPSGLPTAGPSVPASPVPSPIVSVAPSATGSVAGGGRVFTPAQLAAAHIAVPAWHSAAGASVDSLCDSFHDVKVASSKYEVNHEPNQVGTIWIIKTVSANLDSDPGKETAALLSCQYGEAAEDMVVGFDRDAAGQPVFLGVVTEGVIWYLDPVAGGGVTVQVSDVQPCCGISAIAAIHEDRGFAWTGSQFSQVSGKTSFFPRTHPALLSISVSSHGWSPERGGSRTGTVVMTIKDVDSQYANNLIITTADDSTWIPGTGLAYGVVDGLRPGQSFTLRFTLRVPTSKTALPPKLNVYEVGTDTIGSTGQTVSYPLWS